jgi:hypothetical protein
MYVDSFRAIRAVPPVRDASDQAAFAELLRTLLARHAGVVESMARGVAALRKEISARAFANGALMI